MKDSTKDVLARVAASLLFLLLFVGGPSVLAVVGGAALGGTGGGSSESAFWTTTSNGNVGNATTSIEFVSEDCAGFVAGTHPSGWIQNTAASWGAFGGPYAQFFDAGGSLWDCSATRDGQLVVQPGRAEMAPTVRSVGLTSEFSIYMKVSHVNPVRATDGLGGAGIWAFGTGTPSDYVACTYSVVSSGTRVIGQVVARTSGVTNVAVTELPFDTTRPRVLLLQKTGTTGRCFLGSEDGVMQEAGTLTGVAAGAGSSFQYVTARNGTGAFATGTPYLFIDYIRVIDGNGAYFP